MTQPAWLTKWQAREALQNGQPEEAHRLLEGLLTEGNRRAWALQADVVRGYVERAERGLRQDQVEAAWADLHRAESLAPADHRVIQLRETLTRLGLAEVRACLECGKPLQGIRASARLKERPAHSPELLPLEEAAQEWILAQEIADRGDFYLARQALERARRRFSGRSDALDRFEERLGEREAQYQLAMGRFKESLTTQQWREAIEQADAILTVAPQQRDIQQSRTRSWQALQPVHTPNPPSTLTTSTIHNAPHGPASPPKRFLLWIDGVGSYLVCLGSRITFGQSTPESNVDIPLFADISRIHACLLRDGEQYLIETSKGVLVNGVSVERTFLVSGDQLSLSRSCEFVFQLPMPGSSTARLETEAIQRLPHSVNGIILMSEMVILGPGPQAHIPVGWSQPLYLVRDRDQLSIRWKGAFYVDGQKNEDRANILNYQGSVHSDQFSFAIEPFGTKAG